MKPRAIAHKILYNVINNHHSLNNSFLNIIPANVDPREIGFIKDCCFGVLRWFYPLSHIKSKLLHKPLKKKDSDIDCLILLGLFQILHTNVPDHAAVSETVSICKTLKKDWATGLINTCLRRFIREKESLLSSIQNDEVAKFSHPLWLIKKIKTAWPNRWESILTANNQKPPLWLRINCQKTSQTEYLDLLTQHIPHGLPREPTCDGVSNTLKGTGSEAIASPHLPSAILLKKPIAANHIPQFKAGFVSVQDLAGQFAANLLDLKPEQRVLDACAAPGSKTSHILETQPHLSKLVIIDNDPKRLPLIKENLTRLALPHHHTQLVLAEAQYTKTWWNGTPFDRILLDAPCSSTGVIRRHPDIKLLRHEADVRQIAQRQAQLLTILWDTLKPQGKLLYSTCSILPEENEHIIDHFLTTHHDACVEKIALPIGENQIHGIQLFPKEKGTDGFYYALLSKK